MLILLLALLTVPVVVVGVLARRRLLWRRKGRRWLPLHQAMLHDAAAVPFTYLARIHTRPEPDAGGQVMATDLVNGASGALHLSRHDFPPGAVVAFTTTSSGPQIISWMTGRLWNACAYHAASDHRRTEHRLRAAADEAIAAAEQITRDHNPR